MGATEGGGLMVPVAAFGGVAADCNSHGSKGIGGGGG